MIMNSKYTFVSVLAVHLNKGSYILFEGKPYKVVDVKVSKIGKFAKTVVGIHCVGAVSGESSVFHENGNTEMTQFQISKKEYKLSNVYDDELEYFDEDDKLVWHKTLDGCAVSKKLRDEFDETKQYMVTLIRIPHEESKGVYVDDEIVESYNLQLKN